MKTGIMVPLDGTRFAEAALPAAMRLARRDGLSIQLVTVWQPMLPLYDASGELETWERDSYAEREMYLAEVAERVQEVSGRPVSVKFLTGRAAEVLPPLAEPGSVELVVMATHGRGPFLRAGLGSVADQVVRKGNVPVLLVRPEEESPDVLIAPARPFRRVLVPLDGSELAETALQRSLIAGHDESVDVTLLRVVGFPLPAAVRGDALPPAFDERLMSAERDAAQRYLDRVAEWIAPWGWRVSTDLVENTSASAGIVGYAAENRVDLIAMATHGRGGAQRLLLGSVANKVIRSATVPVLLTHPQHAPSPWRDVERLAGQVVGMP